MALSKALSATLVLLLTFVAVPTGEAAISGAGVQVYMAMGDVGAGWIPCPVTHPVTFSFTQYNTTTWMLTVEGPELSWCGFGSRSNNYYDTGYWAGTGSDKTETWGCYTVHTVIDPFLSAGPFKVITTVTDDCTGESTSYRVDLVSSGDNST